MPRGYRSIILAAVGCLILVGAAKDENQQGHQRQASSQGGKEPAAALIVKPTISADDSQPAQEKCVGPDGEQETCSRASAQATVDQARDAHWQAIAEMAGVAVGVFTLGAAVWAGSWAKAAARHTESGSKEAKRGADEAARSADAAQTQSDLSLRNFETDNRAWLVVDNLVVSHFNISRMRDNEDEYDIFFARCHVQFRNVGRSPTVRYDVTLTPVGPDHENYMAFREQRFPVFSYEPMINCLAPSEKRTKSDYRWRKIDELITIFEDGDPGIISTPHDKQSVLPQVGVIIRYQAAVGGICETRQLWRIGVADGEGVKGFTRGDLRPGILMPATAALERTFIMT